MIRRCLVSLPILAIVLSVAVVANAQVPVAPTVLSPQPNPPVGPLPTFVWLDQPAANITQWRLYVKTSTGGDYAISYSRAQANCDGAICAVAWQILLPGGANRCWIKGYNPAGAGPWSAQTNFTVAGSFPAQPIGLSPHTTAGPSPTFAWDDQPADNVTQWLLYIRTAAGGGYSYLYSPAQANCDGTACSVAAPRVLPTGSTSWWVRASNAVGVGPWSTQTDFAVAGSFPAQPTGLLPNATEEGPSPTFLWDDQPADNVTEWRLYIRTSAEGDYSYLYSPAQANCDGTACSIASPRVLTAGSTSWWVRASNAVGVGPWSTQTDFAVTGSFPAQPAGLLPDATEEGPSPTFEWDDQPDDNVMEWQLYFRTSDGADYSALYSIGYVDCDGDTCLVDSPIVFPGGLSSWWVRASNAVGMGPWSAQTDFTVAGSFPAQPAGLLPDATEEGPSPTFEWDDQPDDSVVQWRLYIRTSAGADYSYYYTPEQAICDGLACSVASPKELPLGATSWWIRAENAVGWSPWSTQVEFTVVLQ
jgi:hypothetical protein